MSSSPPPPPPPQDLVGFTIDSGRFQLVSLLGIGTYGTVYLAFDLLAPPNSSHSPYFAAKCMLKAPARSRQRQFQQREIALHGLTSSHPNVVSVYKVLDEGAYYFLLMDYCPDGDLFAMITEKMFYLGKDELVRSVFIQILDAVRYCHSVGVFHRDLKPENILCCDGGRTVVLADFGLATMDQICCDFGAGSSYYMSPECLDALPLQTQTYSAAQNDVWALGVILVNLSCGRNPWKQATISDEIFAQFLKDPNFLPCILPVSREINEILKGVFRIDPRKRMGIEELRESVLRVKTFTMSVAELRKAHSSAREAGLEILEAREGVRRKNEGKNSVDLSSRFSDDSIEFSAPRRGVRVLSPLSIAPFSPRQRRLRRQKLSIAGQCGPSPQSSDSSTLPPATPSTSSEIPEGGRDVEIIGEDGPGEMEGEEEVHYGTIRPLRIIPKFTSPLRRPSFTRSSSSSRALERESQGAGAGVEGVIPSRVSILKSAKEWFRKSGIIMS